MTENNNLPDEYSGRSYVDEFFSENYWNIIKNKLQNIGDRKFIYTTSDVLSFSEINNKANVIWEMISRKNQFKKSGFGLFIKNPISMVSSMIGVLKSGNYMVPMDVNFPQRTLVSMIRNAEIKVILSEGKYYDQIIEIIGEKIKVINLDSLDYRLEIPDPEVLYAPEDIVQVLFTSGSTGEPKGVIEDYRYFLRAIRNRMLENYYNENDRHLQLSTFSFTGPHIRVFLSMLAGNSLHYYDLKEDGITGLPQWLREQRITYYSSTPTVFRSFMELLSPGETFPDVVKYSGGGEKKLLSDIQLVRSHFPNVKIFHLGYGSTETHNVTASNFPIDYDFGQKQLPSGKPSLGMQVFIWDDQGNSLPPETEGEIVVYSDALARGYINNPKLTGARFIPDNSRPGWQYYKSGDLGKLTMDGQLVHLGRIDQMVKINGIRIEVETIEELVLSFPGVINVASKPVENQKRFKRLAVYFVGENGITIPVSEIRKFLAERLPKHQLPHYLIQLNELPIIQGRGKIDRSRLPEPNMIRPELPYSYKSANDELEKNITNIWEDEIGITGIGIDDDFFDIGGDSLIGVLLFARIEKEMGQRIPVSVLLVAPTIRKQAELIRDYKSQDSARIIPIRTTGNKTPIFFIPGKGVYPIRVRHLTAKIDENYPVYALQNLDSVNDREIKNFTNYIASSFVNEIRKIYPHGPYILIGESWGGKVVFEMAQLFLQINESVPFVVMLDTYYLDDKKEDHPNRNNPNAQYFSMLIRKHISILWESDSVGRIEYFRFYQQYGWKQLKLLVESIYQRNKKNRSLEINTVNSIPQNIIELENRRNQGKPYISKPYAGRVIYIKAARGQKTDRSANGWEDVGIRDLITYNIDCYHGSILFDPAVSRLAEIIQKYLT